LAETKIIEFFKSAPGFERLLRAMFDTYSHSGRVFGAVRLTRPSEEEETALSEFFKRDYYDQALIRIGLADFERQIQKRFPQESEGVGLGEILAQYTGKPTPKNRHTRGEISQKGTMASNVLAEIMPKFENTIAAGWLKEISRQTRREYRRWAEQYNSEPQEVIRTIQEVSEALNNLPNENKLTPLAKFSKRFTSASLDFHSSHGRLFLKALAFKFNQPSPACTDDFISLHLRAGLLSCGKISGVTVHGINGQNETQMLTLESLSRVESVSVFGGKVFIFEEPLIFNAVCEQLNNFRCTIINPPSTNSAAFLYLLKMLHAAKIPMYYAGNMTVKSLEIADKLCLEFGKTITPWRYRREDYELILQQENAPLQGEKKQLSLHNETLASLLSLMRKTGKTASSIPLVPLYVDEIKTK